MDILDHMGVSILSAKVFFFKVNSSSPEITPTHTHTHCARLFTLHYTHTHSATFITQTISHIRSMGKNKPFQENNSIKDLFMDVTGH